MEWVPFSMFAWRVISFGAGIFLSLTSVLCADPVALTARDGSVEIAGDLRGFDGKYYRIETEYGELTLDAAKVRCGGPGCPEPGTFVAKARISAARPAGQSLIPALIETFASRKGLELQRAVSAGDGTTFELIDPSEGQSVAQFDMRLMTSAEAFADIVADEADIAISVREISPAEAQLARAAGRGILTASGRSTILALDALVPVVSVTNDVSSLSIQDFRDVLTGKTATWTQLTGGQGDLSVHVSRAAPGYVEALQRYLLRDAPLTAPNVVHHLDHRALDRTVSEDPFALGLSVYSEVRDAQPLALTGPCGVSAQATNGSLKTEDYPLTTPVFAYTPARRVAPFIAEFLTYANSPAAQPVVRRSGFVDQFPEAIPLETQGERLANAILRAGEETSLQELQRMVAAMAGRSRLSITFRFKDG